MFLSTSNATGAFNGIQFTTGANNEGFFGVVQESGGAGAFVFQGYTGAAYTERMRIDSSGNVGIGTASPAVKLQVTTSGAAALPPTSGTTPSTGELIRLRTSSDSAGGIGTIGLSTNQMWLQACDATNLGAYYQLLLNPNGGNVGIGTAPLYKLESAKDITYSDNTVDGDAQFSVAGATTRTKRMTFGYDTSSGDGFGFIKTGNQGSAYTPLYLNPANSIGGGVCIGYAPSAATPPAQGLLVQGNLLVGTTSSFNAGTHCFDANAASYTTAIRQQSATGSGIHISVNSNNGTSQFLYGLGAGTASIIIYSNGDIKNANNSYGAISDAKLKENIFDATPKLDDLMKVKIRQFNLVSDKTKNKQIGVIAQELEEVFAGMVDTSNDKDVDGNDLGTTTKSVKYSVFVPILIKSLQELNANLVAELQSVRQRLATLESK
jgi:hypothetical protein